jgi:hypothetical protein
MAGLMGCDEIANTPNLVSINPGIYFLQRLILPRNYTGYLGPFFILAKFNNS